MSKMNTKREVKLTDNQNDFQLLERSVMSTMLWEDNFYEDGVSINKRIQELIIKSYQDEEYNIRRLIQLIKKVKFDMNLRHVPLFMIRELARLKLTANEEDEKKVVSELLTEVITRADDITEFMAMYFTDIEFKEKKQPIAAFIKQGLTNAFYKFDEYSLAKYAGYDKKISLKDVMCLVRPKPKDDEQAKLWKRLIEKSLKTPDTWEVELSKGGDKKTSWQRLLKEKKLGGLAMLRNIRNMKQANIGEDLICEGIQSVQAGKLLPINFISSAIVNPEFAKQLQDKFMECLRKEKALKGTTVVLLDVSGSMNDKMSAKSEMTRRDIAAALGIILNESCQYAKLFGFNDSLIPLPNIGGFQLIETLKRYSGGTALYQAIQAFYNEKIERVVVITDEQDNGGRSGNVFSADKKYYIINVAPYQKSIEFTKHESANVVRINGWSDKVVDYIIQTEK